MRIVLVFRACIGGRIDLGLTEAKIPQSEFRCIQYAAGHLTILTGQGLLRVRMCLFAFYPNAKTPRAS
jgi:hypothetical protein